MGLESLNEMVISERVVESAERDTVDLKKLRDELNMQKGAYNESVKNNKNAVTELIEILKKFESKSDQMKLLAEFNIDTSLFSSIDFEQLTTNEGYLRSVIKYFEDIAAILEKDLCKNLGIDPEKL